MRRQTTKQAERRSHDRPSHSRPKAPQQKRYSGNIGLRVNLAALKRAPGRAVIGFALQVVAFES